MLKRHKLTPIRILALVGWIFIIVGLSGLGLSFKRSLIYTSVVSEIILPLPAACPPRVNCLLLLKAIVTIPRKLELYQSTPLTVSVVPKSFPTSLTPEPDQKQIPIRSVFVQYPYPFTGDLLLGTQLSASAFDVDPQKQPLQRLDAYSGQAKELDFSWTITPKYTGQQTLIVTIITPEPSSQQEGQTEQVLSTYVMHLSVNTTTNFAPFLSVGQVTLGELLIILLGSCLNIPWIVELLQKRKETKEKRGKTQLINATKSTNISIPNTSTLSKSSEQLPATQERKRKKGRQ